MRGSLSPLAAWFRGSRPKVRLRQQIGARLLSSHSSTSPQIAIIGAGPAGLTLARLLQKNGVRCKVFEGEKDRHTREQGGSLDMHPDKGLLVIKEAGLYDKFLEHARPEGDVMRILRSDGKVLLDEGEDQGGKVEDTKSQDGEVNGRPEIDRTKLRDILFESLEPDTIQWGHRLARVQPSSDQTNTAFTLEFASGSPSGAFDLVVGADGAWSRVRHLLTDAQPVYSGIGGIEVRITDIDARAPDLARRVGNGTCSSYGDNRAVMSQRNGDGSVRTYAFVRMDAGWLEQSSIDFKGDTREALRRFVEMYFGSWEDEGAKAMVLRADLDAVVVRNIWMLPVGTRWAHRNGVTLIGDAAHVMPPFAGVGVNVAMQDALVLAKHITGVKDLTDDSAISRAIRDYEGEMFDRAEAHARETMHFQDMQFSERGPYPLVEYFEKQMAAAPAGTKK
ncbi:monooxygenase [Hypoxylon rubiginosum]|uniref:Monooxygenase n=1 Tax=Hypoxylon rubiginosum TaxID=110542 RepID=A0ACB9YLM7_9PEZI|nr:monooxygenase [Hypoxylon rubiginosum]